MGTMKERPKAEKTHIGSTTKKQQHKEKSVSSVQDNARKEGSRVTKDSAVASSQEIHPGLIWLLFYMFFYWAVAAFLILFFSVRLSIMASLYETGCCVAGLGVFAVAFAGLPELQSLLRGIGVRTWGDSRAWLCILSVHLCIFGFCAVCLHQYTDLKLRWLSAYLLCTYQIRLQEGINCISLEDQTNNSARKNKQGQSQQVTVPDLASSSDAVSLRAAKIMSTGHLVSLTK
jgi:hypothetical protein